MHTDLFIRRIPRIDLALGCAAHEIRASSTRPGCHRRGTRRRSRRGFTLVELVIAATLLSMGVIAVFGSLLHARRLSEGSIYQSAAVTVVQGYIEQMKAMEFAELPYTTPAGSVVAGGGATATQVPTRLNANTLDPLVISTTTIIPALSTLNVAAGTTAGVTNNLKTIDVNSTPTVVVDDLRLNLRVWIQDISNPAISATQVRAITVHYAWQNGTGANARTFRSSVRTIRSAVPTY